MVMNANQAIEVFSLHHISSSEDSNSSWQTVINPMAASQNAHFILNGAVSSLKVSVHFSLFVECIDSYTHFSKQKLPNSDLSEIVLKELRRRYNGRSSLQQTELETAQQSMELMRQNVQDLFDSEVQVIVQKYIDVSGNNVNHFRLGRLDHMMILFHFRHILSQL